MEGRKCRYKKKCKHRKARRMARVDGKVFPWENSNFCDRSSGEEKLVWWFVAVFTVGYLLVYSNLGKGFLPLWSRLLSGSMSSLSFSSSDTIASSSSSVLFLGSHVILFSFFSRRRALANQVDTCVSVILVMMASIIFSPLVGYGFFLCSLSHAFSVAVDSRVAFFLRAAKS